MSVSEAARAFNAPAARSGLSNIELYTTSVLGPLGVCTPGFRPTANRRVGVAQQRSAVRTARPSQLICTLSNSNSSVHQYATYTFGSWELTVINRCAVVNGDILHNIAGVHGA